jgi:hypothetical protein
MDFKRASWLLNEVSREYGLLGLRFGQVADRKISPEECAKAFVEGQDKIVKYLAEFKAGLHPEKNGT